ncbi:integral membrane protein [Calycina marina]|uniref:Integral membrane protein n=1 Tax=Calycina marina TaxID=1763456 RepID=A0A9P7YYJ3_9HELO|nr:integral membrane protein [Calycina marina]
MPNPPGKSPGEPSSSLRVPKSSTTQTQTTTTTTTSGGGKPPVTTTTGSVYPVSTTTVTQNQLPPRARTARPRLDSWQQPSIRIRRVPAQLTLRPSTGNEERPGFSSNIQMQGRIGSRSPEATRTRAESVSGAAQLRPEAQCLEPMAQGNRRRSSSDPARLWNTTHDGTGAPRGGASYMPELAEESRAGQQNLAIPTPIAELEDTRSPMARRMSTASGMFRFPSFRPASAAGRERGDSSVRTSSPRASTFGEGNDDQYHQDMIDILDTIDPEVSTLNTLNNLQNSLFVPDLGRFLNRRPTYNLTKFPTKSTVRTAPDISFIEEPTPEEPTPGRAALGRTPTANTLTSITSRLDDSRFAVLPHGERLQGWSKEERDELNEHVRHLLHSRKEKFKRAMKGFGQYVRKPLGFFVTLYATLITLFGLAWVLFLIGWINVGGKKDYIVNIIDNVLVALFAIMGDGLAPFRAIDTYHMSFIAHYHHLSWHLRKERAMPKLKDQNDLPVFTVNQQIAVDCETAEEKFVELSVLNPQQQKKLVHHQKKFSRSHTFYKPHETETHFAFPLRFLVAVVVLLDCHSCFQIALGACTWAISYKTRSFALTTVILCCSITCNITAGVIISIGDHKTRKKDVLERMFRQELTAQAIQDMTQKREEAQKKQSVEGLLRSSDTMG